MGFEITLTSTAEPECVLAAIRENAREWRESVVPAELRARGVRRMVARIRGDAFTLSLPSFSESAELVALRGTVTRTADGRTRVDARCGLSYRPGLAAGILAVPGLWLLVTGSAGAGIALLGLAGIGLAADRVGEVRITPEGSAAARYLVERLQAAVAEAESRPPG